MAPFLAAHWHNGRAVIEIKGVLDTATARELRDFAASVHARHRHQHLILDLSDLMNASRDSISSWDSSPATSWRLESVSLAPNAATGPDPAVTSAAAAVASALLLLLSAPRRGLRRAEYTRMDCLRLLRRRSRPPLRPSILAVTAVQPSRADRWW
ncbi:hypothetical protein [Streptomyces durhamensis]|uniref:hypothetical protein n=1 Tax=Streptomyces durhamensis TaxID=68194 RepID=UPI0012FE96BD|nr:hypothetical protein [Streptomyces durhamensis]